MQIFRGDRITAQTFPGLTLQVVACFDEVCGCTCDHWPRGATHPVKLWEITSVNDRSYQYPKPQTQQTKRRQSAA